MGNNKNKSRNEIANEKIVEKSISKELVHCKDHKKKMTNFQQISKAKKREDINYPYQECNRILLLTFQTSKENKRILQKSLHT